MERASKSKVSIVIPCFNEEKGLPSLISKLESVKNCLLESFEVELVFVDDGSTDATYKLLDEKYQNVKGVQMVKHIQNRGIGAALRTGFSKTSGDIIVTVDSDCTYDPEEIPYLLSYLKDGVDVVVGSPYHPKGKCLGVPGYRFLLSKWLSLIYSFLLKSDIHTYTGLFRAYRRSVLDELHFVSDGFVALAEILIKIILGGKKVVEYPTTLCVRQYGESKLKILKTIFEHLKLISVLILKKKTLKE